MTQDPSSYSSVIPFSIEQALDLMRQLPIEDMNKELVLKVARTTLESAGVSLPQLMNLADQREGQITDEIVRLQGEISSLKEEIDKKTEVVSQFQEQLGDIGSLREFFEE